MKEEVPMVAAKNEELIKDLLFISNASIWFCGTTSVESELDCMILFEYLFRWFCTSILGINALTL